HHHFYAPYPGLTPGATLYRLLRRLVVAVLLAGVFAPNTILAQTISNQSSTSTQTQAALARYLDSKNGITADEAVAYALIHNGELEAARKEIDAARALVKQAHLRANPKLDINGAQQI